jgi:hypothetical protein
MRKRKALSKTVFCGRETLQTLPTVQRLECVELCKCRLVCKCFFAQIKRNLLQRTHMMLQIPHGMYWSGVEIEYCQFLRQYLLNDGLERSLQGSYRSLIEELF